MFDRLFQFLSGADLSAIEMFYLGCAIVGGGLFALRAILMVVGMGGEDHDGGDFGESDGSPVHDFRFISVHGVTAFMLMFGLVGFLMLRNNTVMAKIVGIDGVVKLVREPAGLAGKPWFVGLVAFAVGAATMFVIAKIFQSFRKLQSDGTIHPEHAVGAAGSVYLAIRPGEIGKVQLTVRGAMKFYDARAKDSSVTLKTGDAVKVVATGDVLVVESA